MSRLRNPYLPWAIGVAVLAILAGDSSVLAARQARPPVPMSVAVERHLVTEKPAAAKRREQRRTAALTALFERRAEAVRKRDRAAFLSGLDSRQPEFVAHETEVFESLTKLDFGAWAYELTSGSYSVTGLDLPKYAYADDLWLPVVILRYRLDGYDTLPVGRRVVYTAVRRDGHWYLGSDSDLDATTSSGTSVRVDPWENGPIVVERSKHGLVIGHPGDGAAVKEVARALEDAVGHVTKYAGVNWPQQVVVVLPTDQDELNRVLESPTVFFDFAAIADREYTMNAEGEQREYAGSRVVINPSNFDADSWFTKVLLRHEVTHVALEKRTGPFSPKWLVEGIADYVGNSGAAISVDQLGGDLGELVDKSGMPGQLPGDSDFGLTDDAGVAYEGAWLACRYIASRWGQPKLFALYDEMGGTGGSFDPDKRLAGALKKVLGIDEATLVRGWRPYARAAVADLGKLLAKPRAAYREVDKGQMKLTDFADERHLAKDVFAKAGAERAGEGLFVQGNATTPTRMLIESVVIGRDEPAAVRVERTLGARYEKYDRGVAIPHGRLYLVSVKFGARTYNAAAALLRAGTVVLEVRVLVPVGVDAVNEAREQAAKQYAAFA